MTRWSGPGRALQAHLELWERCQHTKDEFERATAAVEHGGSGVGLDYAASGHVEQLLSLATSFAGLPNSALTEDGASVGPTKSDPTKAFSDDNVMRAHDLRRKEYRIVNEGITHYVSEEMMNMVAEIAAQLEPEPIFETDLPCPVGLIVFEEPFLTNDLHPETGEPDDEIIMPIRGIGWMVTDDIAINRTTDDNDVITDVEFGDGIVLIPFTDPDSFDEHFLESMELKNLLEGRSRQNWREHLPNAAMWMIDYLPWAFGRPWSLDDTATTLRYVDGELAQTVNSVTHADTIVGSLRRLFLAFARLTWQRLTELETVRPNRAQRRQLERAGRTPDDGYIKVLRLRRREHTPHGPDSDADGSYGLNYRLIVRGHQRRQWYPSLGPARLDDGSMNPESHRLIWIEPHIRGPEDRPLVIGNSVSAVVR